MGEETKIEVVISGISGRFPESNSIKEFISHLFQNHNLVTSTNRRFPSGIYNIPKGFGTLREIDKFDAEFFGILPKQAECMDPQLRLGLETTYEALFDAGVNPVDQRGSRTGVFTAIISHEALEIWYKNPGKMNGVNLIGNLGSMIPNRISYCFDFNGPSASYDTACSSSIFALDAAVTAIRTGKCDAAVVMGACLIFSPYQSVMRYQAGMLASDSVPRCFDSKGLGYVRAEAVATIYLQKICDAKKAYASIAGIGTNTDGFKQHGIFHPSALMQEKLLEEVYSVAGVDPAEVTYLEAHATGTPAGDPEEFKAIERHFCLNKNRTQPLLVGSVKSNMGHAEAASGLCSIAKIVAILQSGLIPANLHFSTPHFSMKSIRDGKITIVDKNTEWHGGYIGLNSFGFGGVNAHVILKPNSSSSIGQSPTEEIECKEINSLSNLVTFEGRSEDGVKMSIKELIETDDKGQLYLLNEINKRSTKGEFRGYGIIGPETLEINRVASGKAKPTVWFVINGMGSQWTGMGRSLFQIPAFKSSFDLCAQTLLPFNYNLYEIYFSNDPTTFDLPTNAFTCIGVTQVALLDILRLIGVKADGMLGHSMGETLCAYADGCMTLQETVLSIYLRGKTCEDLKSTQTGSFGMAAVPLSGHETAKFCPSGLVVACHNGSHSATVSGPTELIVQLQEILKPQNMEVKEVNSCGLAFHSEYVLTAATQFLEILRPLLKYHVRSKRWVSTSIPADESATLPGQGQLFGPEYLYNNFLRPVLFEQALTHIPPNCVVVEIGPSGLLRGLIQRGTSGTTVIPLQARNADGMLTFQKALGRLFVSGVNFDLNKVMGQPVERLLPSTTASLGHLVTWDHSQSWGIPEWKTEDLDDTCGTFEINLGKEEHEYLRGHVIGREIVYPPAGYICLVWKYFATIMHYAPKMENVAVVFENLKFHRSRIVHSMESIVLKVNVLKVSGQFEVIEDTELLCTGKIRMLKTDEATKISDLNFDNIQMEGITTLSKLDETQTTEDIYKRLRFLGYEYSGQFKGIQKVDPTGTHFLLYFNPNWVPFIDTMLQTTCRIYEAKDYQTEIFVPIEISKITINPSKFRSDLTGGSCVVYYDTSMKLIRCQGIEVDGVNRTNMKSSPSHDDLPTIISHHAFDPYLYTESDEWKNDSFSPLLLSVSVAMENLPSAYDTIRRSTPRILEVCFNVNNLETQQVAQLIRTYFRMPDIDYTLYADDVVSDRIQLLARNLVKTKSLANLKFQENQYDLILLDDFLLINEALTVLSNGGFLVLKLCRHNDNHQKLDKCLHSGQNRKFHLIGHKFSKKLEVFLIRKKLHHKSSEVDVIIMDSSTSWVVSLATAMIRQEKILNEGLPCPRLFLVSTGNDDLPSGLLGLTLCLRKEPWSQNVRCIYSPAYKLQLDFSRPSDLLQEILDKDLAFNVIDDKGRLGSYLHSEIQLGHDVSVGNTWNQVLPIKTQIYFNPMKSYVILGGLGGVGLELVNWMTLRNARYIVITSRTGRLTPYSRNYLKIWQERGVVVNILAKNAIEIEEAREIFRVALKMGEIGGIFNLTLELDINLIRDQTPAGFQKVTDPKIKMTFNLDHLSRLYCKEIDHFVVFSSISSAIGFDGQGNYGFANSGAERLIERRIQDGLPGRAIQWGPIAEVGVWHTLFNSKFGRTDFHGVGIHSIRSVLEDLDILLTLPGPPVTFCRKMVKLEGALDQDFESAKVNLLERVAHILGHSSSAKLNCKHKLVDLGMDSLMSTEIIHLFKNDYGIELSKEELRKYTLEQVVEISENCGKVYDKRII